MKRNKTLRKLVAFILSMVLTLSMTAAAFATEGSAPVCTGADGCTATAHESNCPKYTENTGNENEDGNAKNPSPAACTGKNDCPLADGHGANCPKHPDNQKAIADVQMLIEKLPTASDITPENRDDVEAKLKDIKKALEEMNETCRALVDATKYVAAEKALEALTATTIENPSSGETKNEENKPADNAPQNNVPENNASENNTPESNTPENNSSETPPSQDNNPADNSGEDKKDQQPAPSTDPTPEEVAAKLLASLPAEVTKDNIADVEKSLAAIAGYENVLTPEQKVAQIACQAKVDAVYAQMNLDRVIDLMGKLPEAGTITAESLTEEQANAYKAQMTEIDSALLTLTDEQKAAVDKTRYESLANALGSYYEIMNMENAVAKIGSTPYATLTEAINEIQTSGTITLLESITDCPVIKIDSGKEVTIELSDKNITFATGAYFLVCNGTLSLTGNGKLSEGSPYLSPIVLKGVGNDGVGSVVNIGSGVTSEGWTGLFIDKNDSGNEGIVANVSGTLIGVRDTANSVGIGLYVNGAIGNTGKVPQITLTGATVKTVDGGTGMYLAGYAETTITDSIVTSDNTGIEIRAGKLTISGSTTVTGGNGEYNYQGNGNGSTSSNAALAIAQHDTKLPLEVTIKGGTFSGGAAVAQANPQGNNDDATALVTLDIQNGDFTGKIYSENKGAFVTGGTFSAPVDAKYCANNFHCNAAPDGDGKYTVHEHKIKTINKVEATCGEDGYSGDEVCSTCGEIMTKGHVENKTGKHTFSNWDTHLTSCLNGGYRIHTCTVCGAEERETILAGSHSFSTDWVYNEALHWHNCTVCGVSGDIQSHDFQWVAVSQDASGDMKQVCKECGYVATTDWSKLTLTLKASRSTVRPGRTVTYYLTVLNKTGKDLNDVVVSSGLDKNVTFSKATGQGKYDSKTDLWTISELKDGNAAYLTLKVNVKDSVPYETKLDYTAIISDAEAYNGEVYPEESPNSPLKVTVTVTKVATPETGDVNLGVWIAVLGVSLAALIAVSVILIVKSRKKK